MQTIRVQQVTAVEVGDYAQVNEFDATVIEVDSINEVCTVEYCNDAGNIEQLEVPFAYM